MPSADVTPQLLVLGTRKGVILYRRGAEGWAFLRHAHLGVPVPYAFVDPRNGWLWASLDHGHWGQKLSVSTDLGLTWREVPEPAFAPGTERVPGEPAAVRYLWVLAPGAASQPGRLYAGTEPGGLFVSDDHGESWQLNEPLWNHPSRTSWFGGGRDQAGIHSICVDPRDPQWVRIGISCAGVFETRDGGSSWFPRNEGTRAEFLPNQEPEVGQDVHFLAQCTQHPEVLWQQNHCGIYRSTNDGNRWTPVSAAGQEAHFGFVVAAHPGDPLQAWVVPAISDECRTTLDGALRVCRTRDGGASWQTLTQGLPQQACYDLVFRHGLDLCGETLAMGSTTGNLFVSDDAGDTWSCLSSWLPPIYSVRFASVRQPAGVG